MPYYGWLHCVETGSGRTQRPTHWVQIKRPIRFHSAVLWRKAVTAMVIGGSGGGGGDTILDAAHRTFVSRLSRLASDLIRWRSPAP
jgi:hypothetical protein